MVKMTENQKELQDANENLVISDATRFDCQVAGHSVKKGRGSLDFLSHKDGYVLKPVLKNEEQGRREIEFYEELRNASDPTTKELNKFVPRYFGTTRLKSNGQEVRWIVLKNATHQFRQPCVMDVKIGARTWDPLATEEKRFSEEAKYRECKRDLGFCIPGFQVYKLPAGELVRKDRTYGKSLDGKSAKAAVRTFLNEEFGLSRSLVLEFLAKLWKILRWFRTQTKYRFYSSSLLLVYDAARLKQIHKRSLDPPPASEAPRARPTIGRQLSLRAATGPLTPGFGEGSSGQKAPPGSPVREDWHTMFDNVCKTHSLVNNYETDLKTMKENYEVVLKDLMDRSDDQYGPWVSVNMIDFAHVFHSNSEDTDKNYLNGLQSLINIFEECLVEADC